MASGAAVIASPGTTTCSRPAEGTTCPAESLPARAACFVACIPSGGALLAKLWGVASMQTAALGVALPCCAGLVGVWSWARRSGREGLATALAVGFVAGLLGTVGYDLIRVPVHLAGQRVFAPISVYGIWIADAKASSRFTEVLGWGYHVSNGITFGIMYALFMRGRHWGWAVLWAFALETIAVLSPFARIFALSGQAIGSAYLAHVAYGVPLGLLVQEWSATRSYLARVSPRLRAAAMLVGCAVLLWPLVSPAAIHRDARTAEGRFRVDGDRLDPSWLRIERGETVRIVNPGPDSVSVVLRERRELEGVPGGQERVVPFPRPGVYQLHVETERRSRSSFVIVEPVEDLD